MVNKDMIVKVVWISKNSDYAAIESWFSMERKLDFVETVEYS